MIISTRGRYALRVMIDLSQQDPDSYTPLKEIAARQDLQSLEYHKRAVNSSKVNTISRLFHF